MVSDDASPFRPRMEPVLVTLPDTCRVAARLFGPENAPPVLFIAGGDGRMLQWRGLIPELCVDAAERELLAAAGCEASLAADLRVATFDARGTGWSSRSHGVCATTGAAAADALALAAAVFERPFHVVGHALGAAVALELALAAGRLVRSLTLISGSAGGDALVSPTQDVFAARAALADALEGVVGGGVTGRCDAAGAGGADGADAGGVDDVDAAGHGLAALVRHDVELAYTASFAEGHAKLLDHLAAEALDDLLAEAELARHGTQGATAAEARGEQFAALDLVARLVEVATPTLGGHGEHDAVLPLGNGKALADGIPGARLVVLDAGHAVTIERAEDLAASLRAHVLLHP